MNLPGAGANEPSENVGDRYCCQLDEPGWPRRVEKNFLEKMAWALLVNRTMFSAAPCPSPRVWRLGGFLLGLCLVPSTWSASTTNPTPALLLRAELPARVSLEKAPCELLAHALYRAVQTHRSQAGELLSTALSGDRLNGQPAVERSCACVRQLFHAARSADPKQTAHLLEQTISLYPGCAEELEREAAAEGDKNVVSDSKDPVFDPSFRDGIPPVADPTNAPDGFNTPGDLYGGFGVGFGPGFPGSPGFTGSSPSGAVALPPGQTPVTSVVNG